MDKYTDNMLAEEFDYIILIKDKPNDALFGGALGVLIDSYTRHDKPLYGLFACENGENKEVALSLFDFRVLNPRVSVDIKLIADYVNSRHKNNAVCAG